MPVKVKLANGLERKLNDFGVKIASERRDLMRLKVRPILRAANRSLERTSAQTIRKTG